jgi:hypothetical protein
MDYIVGASIRCLGFILIFWGVVGVVVGHALMWVSK